MRQFPSIGLIILTLIMGYACSGKADKSVAEIPADDDSLAVMSIDQLPFIDLTAEAKQMDVNLDDIAEVRYVPLETTDESLIRYVRRLAMGGDRIVISDFNEINIFDTDGRFISKINRKDAGPHGYTMIMDMCVDFDNQLIYILDGSYPRKIKAYDFDGYRQKGFVVPNGQAIHQLALADSTRLIAYYERTGLEDYDNELDNHSYKWINTSTGEVTPVDIEVENPESTSLKTLEDNVMRMSSFEFFPMVKNGDRLIIADYTHPVVYQVRKNRLLPIFKKTESKPDANGKVTLSTVQTLTDNYILLWSLDKSVDNAARTISADNGYLYLYDRKTGELIDADFKLPQSSTRFQPLMATDLPANTMMDTYSVDLLQSLDEKGRLGGQLKEIADTIDPEANPVLVLVRLK